MSGRSRYNPRRVERELYGDESDLFRESRYMSEALREYLARGGQLLQPKLHPIGKVLVRNATTKQPLLCCHGPCDQTGDNRIQIAIPHQQPRWQGEKLVYIFCSDLCRRAFARGTPYEHYL